MEGRQQAIERAIDFLDGSTREIIPNYERETDGFTVRLARPIVRDRPSIQSRVRPTDSPSSLIETQSKYCVECYDIYSIHSHYKGGGLRPPLQITKEVARPSAAPLLLRFPFRGYE